MLKSVIYCTFPIASKLKTYQRVGQLNSCRFQLNDYFNAS